MESFPLFFRIRAITFTCIMLFSFLWLVLLCVEMFTRWSMSDQISQSLMIVFILANSFTLITLPVLLLVQFRTWLDATRLFLLFILQLGSASAGSVWSPRIQCPDETPDDLGVCQLIIVYTMIACWVIPAILAFYSTYFAFVVYLQSRIPVIVEPKLQNRLSGTDLESGFAGSLSLWNERLKNVVSVQASETDRSVPPRPLVLPTMLHTRQLSLPQSSASQLQSILPNVPPRQPIVPSLPHTGQKRLYTFSSAANRHNSLPAFKHGNAPHLHPVLASFTPHSPATDTSSSCLQTPSTNPLNQPLSFAPSVLDVHSPKDFFGISRHLSMMPPSSSSRKMQCEEECLVAPPIQAKLSKPPPPHLMWS